MRRAAIQPCAVRTACVDDSKLTTELFDENGLGGSGEERQAIAERWHQLDAWPDFAAALRRLQQHHICVSFTILSLSLIVDVSRRNGIDWDAVIPCEMLRVYKPLPTPIGAPPRFWPSSRARS